MERSRELIVLIGMMGAGKTTVGRLVAERLGWQFVDNDVAFEQRTGVTASAYAAEHGDDAMHEVEWATLAQRLDRPERTVLAAPGSVVAAAAGLVDLSEAFVVMLDVDPSVLAERVEIGDHRPLIGRSPDQVLAELHEQRSPRYMAMADLVLSASDHASQELAEQIVTEWEARRNGGNHSGPAHVH